MARPLVGHAPDEYTRDHLRTSGFLYAWPVDRGLRAIVRGLCLCCRHIDAAANGNCQGREMVGPAFREHRRLCGGRCRVHMARHHRTFAAVCYRFLLHIHRCSASDFVIQLRKVFTGEWLYFISGILSIIVGVLLILRPLTGAIALAQTIGIFAIAYGLIIGLLALRLHGTMAGVAEPT